MFKRNSILSPKLASHAQSKTSPSYVYGFNSLATSLDPEPVKIVERGSEFILLPPRALIPSVPPATTKGVSDLGIITKTPNEYYTHERVFAEVSPGRPLPHLVKSRQSVPEEALTRSSVLPTSLFSSSQDITFDFSPPDSPQPSPLKEQWSSVFNPSSEKPVKPRTESRVGKLSDWFSGESEAIKIGVLPASASPTKESSNPLRGMELSGTAQSGSRPTTLSRWSLFTSKPFRPAIPEPKPLNDEYVELNVKTALLPFGQLDPFSPSSFKNLLQHAEGLLIKLQSAYKERTMTLKETLAEKEAQAEELEEARTRAQHLKLQLDDMTTKVAEQDVAMMSLVDELAEEKNLRQEENEARQRTVRMVEEYDGSQEDLFRSRQPPRLSWNTVDSGFESDAESTTNSVFSKQQGRTSPTTTISSRSSLRSPDLYQEAGFPEDSMSPLGTPTQPPIMGQLGHGATYDPNMAVPVGTTPTRTPNAASNRDTASKEAWNVVGVLKEENKGLKQRVGELEVALDGCLQLVHGLGG
ncbi:MAG: hypothetical protein MMC33_003210 [Icmadophila ericetorum]|nr:hypothetical protein [Icmadophila ericetorum]